MTTTELSRCAKMRGSWCPIAPLIGAALTLALAACDGPSAPVARGSSLHYTQTVGRVGYHFVSHQQTSGHDPMNLCEGFSEGAKITSGIVPPGLRMDIRGTFEGTPRQPGEWDVEVTLYGWYCTNSNVPPIDVAVPVHFYIQS